MGADCYQEAADTFVGLYVYIVTIPEEEEEQGI